MEKRNVTSSYITMIEFCAFLGGQKRISKYIRTCHICQLTVEPIQADKPAPLCPVPEISTPFEHLLIDCVATLPMSKAGNVCMYVCIY